VYDQKQVYDWDREFDLFVTIPATHPRLGFNVPLVSTDEERDTSKIIRAKLINPILVRLNEVMFKEKFTVIHNRKLSIRRRYNMTVRKVKLCRLSDMLIAFDRAQPLLELKRRG
jgi:hypothetical protein